MIRIPIERDGHGSHEGDSMAEERLGEARKSREKTGPVSMEGPPETGAPHEPEGPSSEAPVALSAEEKVIVLEERLSEKSLEVEELRDGLLRLQADFENYKKRMAREQREGQALALEGVMRELLPVIDNLERAVQAGEKGSDPATLLQGVRMILHQFREMLRKVGLSEIQAVGEIFNPMVHEALMVVNSEEHPENTIVEEFEKGYKIRDKLLRPAKVSVAKKAPLSGR